MSSLQTWWRFGKVFNFIGIAISGAAERKHNWKKMRLKIWWDFWNIDHERCFNFEESLGSGSRSFICLCCCEFLMSSSLVFVLTNKKKWSVELYFPMFTFRVFAFDSILPSSINFISGGSCHVRRYLDFIRTWRSNGFTMNADVTPYAINWTNNWSLKNVQNKQISWVFAKSIFVNPIQFRHVSQSLSVLVLCEAINGHLYTWRYSRDFTKSWWQKIDRVISLQGMKTWKIKFHINLAYVKTRGKPSAI